MPASAGDASWPRDTACCLGDEWSWMLEKMENVGTRNLRRWSRSDGETLNSPSVHNAHLTNIATWRRQKKCLPVSTGETGVNPPPPCAPGQCGPVVKHRPEGSAPLKGLLPTYE